MCQKDLKEDDQDDFDLAQADLENIGNQLDEQE